MKANTNMLWPPLYSVRKHPRAKRIKLKATKERGLEITVPRQFNIKKIPLVLQENKAWITAQLNQLAAQPTLLPTQIDLLAIQKNWHIRYLTHKTEGSRQSLLETHNELIFLQEVEPAIACKTLALWLKKQAKMHLLSQLNALSLETKLSFQNAIIRDQQTRWGSCSSKGTISLNYKLLFLPANLVRHIILHELCHTQHLNHSRGFWDLLANLDPDFKKNKKDISSSQKYIPQWL